MSGAPTGSDELDAEIAEWRERKQRCAREFGPAKARGEDVAELKRRMQEITRKLDALEEARKQRTTAPEVITDTTSSEPARDEHLTEVVDMTGADLRTDAPVTATDWRHFVEQQPHARAYHDPRWLQVIAEVFEHECYVVTCRQGDALLGGLPLVRQRSRLFGDFLTSLPFVNYGGPLGVARNVESALLTRAGELAARLGCAHVESRDVVARDWPVRTDKISMRLDLPSDIDALSRAIGSKVRAQIKRPEREGASTRVGGGELVDAFYAVFSRNMRDLGTPVMPKRWFERVLTVFRDEAAIVLVELRGRPVAAGLLLAWRDGVEIPWASTVREFNPLGVNMQLYWRCLGWAIERGARRFDFGRSSVDAGTHRFKAQWGATPTQLYWHYWLPEGRALPRINPQNAKYRLLVATWQRLPLPVSRWLGPTIVRSIP